SAAFAGAAQAMTSSDAALENELGRYVQNVDLNGLSNADLAALNAVVHSGDSFNETKAVIKSILAQK
ncbi:MAG: hypothetical protein N4A61_09040, partial [Pelagimonas sp.]|nr:hypothetical protein [Pelagimonas sp.]